MRRLFSFPPVTVLALALAAGCGERDDVPRYGYRVVAEYPHDPDAYTQGLLYHDGDLFESTGQYGRSGVRRVEYTTGVVKQEKALPSTLFGEGLVLHDGELIQITWKAGDAHVFDPATFRVKRNLRYEGEGWGITTDGERLYMSDGSSTISVRDPVTFEERRRIRVTYAGQALGSLNELEWVEGELWANVWKADQIARIDPASGEVVGLVDLSGLLTQRPADPDGVLNGIAYDPETGRLWVTGKLWPKLFEIEVVE